LVNKKWLKVLTWASYRLKISVMQIAQVSMDIGELLKRMVERRASDLHLRVPSPPVLRIDGRLVVQEDLPPVTPEYLEAVLETIVSRERNESFQQNRELDCSYSVRGLARFRLNAMYQRGTISLAFRMVPFIIPNPEELALPMVYRNLIVKPRGLILITGPTGSGKSTTIAAMIDYLNHTASRNVITVEDPIEYVFSNDKCLIAQRDLGEDTMSFDKALVHALRHDPDVIVVGEMRDLETISTAIRAAETGHLVLATLHTIDAAQTVDRIIDAFPENQQRQVRLQLSQVIEAVMSQALLPLAKGKGRVAAFEVMTATPAVRNLIRESKTIELPNIIQLSTQEGMQTLDQALAELVRKHLVTREEAMLKTSNPRRLEKMLLPT
jgi:twitching motility protein PilT